VTGTSPANFELDDLLRRVREAYLDAPSLRLSPSGLQRMFRLGPVRCVEILEALVRENFLRRTSDGQFVRSGPLSPTTHAHNTPQRRLFSV
jgi:hypothetical protein